MTLPVLRELSPLGRAALLATLAASVTTLLLEFVLHADKALIFIVSGAAILGLAWVVGSATERIGALAGPQVGGILNATFGNVAELIIAFFALEAGLVDVVKASLTGSIIGNLLLVLGAALALGGRRNGTQRFNARIAATNSTLLAIAVVGLFVPAVFAFSTAGDPSGSRIAESAFTAIVLIALYLLALAYSFSHPEEMLGAEHSEEHGGPAWSRRMAIGVLLGAAALLAVLSETLVDSVEPFIEAFDLTPFFVGVIIIPTIGNLAEHLVAVQLAWRDRVDFAMAVAIGSSLQIALFVAPVLVLAGVVLGRSMDLVFEPLEVAAVGTAVAVATLITLDGESNELEGVLLLGVYLILAAGFFFLR